MTGVCFSQPLSLTAYFCVGFRFDARQKSSLRSILAQTLVQVELGKKEDEGEKLRSARLEGLVKGDWHLYTVDKMVISL